MWQLRMHCNLRPPDAVPVILHFDCDASAKLEVSQPIRCCPMAFSLLIRYVTLFDPATLTFDLWPWTFCSISAVTWSNSVPNLSKLEQSAVELLRFQYFTLWPLEHVSRVALCSEIIFTQFKLSQPIRSWHLTIFWCWCVVTLWPWPLTPWLWIFVLGYIECHVFKQRTKSNNPRLSYSRFITFFQGGQTFKLYCSEGDGPNCTKFGENRAPSLLHQKRNSVPISCFVSKGGPLKNERCWRSRPNYTHLDPL